MKEILEKKYGAFVTSRLVNEKGAVCLDQINEDGTLEQEEVVQHLRSLKDANGELLIPNHFFNNNVEWGFDFSGWIGSIKDHKKDFVFVGAEPNINHNYSTLSSHYNEKLPTCSQDIVHPSCGS